MKYTPERARTAVQFLVDSPYFAHHIVKLRNALKRPRSLPFKGEAEALNELLVIGRQSPDALENLIEVAEARRSSRNDYQRDYMAKKRKRERLAVELEQALSGRTFDFNERVETMRRYSHAWNERKAAWLGQRGMQVPWVERNQFIKEFWDRIERDLEAKLATAKPVQRARRRVEVAGTPPPFNRGLYDSLKNNSRDSPMH